MTPKEKAKELFNKYADEINFDDIYSNYKKQSKQCALIAVEEIKSAVNTCIPYHNEETYVSYWEEVKQEIENL